MVVNLEPERWRYAELGKEKLRSLKRVNSQLLLSLIIYDQTQVKNVWNRRHIHFHESKDDITEAF